MKIIDLLNKIANGEEVPEYVQYYNMLKDRTNIMMVCKENIFYKLDQLEIQLNSRVEILEEPKGIPKKLEILPDSEHYSNKVLYGKINEIIDCLEYLESKGE